MPCYSPLKGFRSRFVNPSGKRGVVFNRKDGLSDMPVSLPCGQCVGCRLERSRQWAIRCFHEAQMHEDNCFITLTYAPEHLPEDRSLDVTHFQKFMKRLRKRYGSGIRFFHCGEYGEKFFRPHYHACIFGLDFDDKVLWKYSNGVPLYVSDSLAELWPFGFSSIGEVTFESAAYVARYIMKKVTGDMAEGHYRFVDPDTGEVHDLKPEYTTMSRRPGIGASWLAKYQGDVFPSDEVVIRGRRMKPPKYYSRQYEFNEPGNWVEVRRKRLQKARAHSDDNTPARLKVREQVQLAKLDLLPRNLDKDD